MVGRMNEWMTYRPAKKEFIPSRTWSNMWNVELRELMRGDVHAHIRFLKSEGGRRDFNRLNRWVCELSTKLGETSMLWNPELIYFCLNIYWSRIIPSLAVVVIVIVICDCYTVPLQSHGHVLLLRLLKAMVFNDLPIILFAQTWILRYFGRWLEHNFLL